MLSKIEHYILDVIKGKKKGILPLLVKGALRPLSWVYQFGVSWRNRAFDYGWLRQYSPPVPIVISIGNIVAGGTGKTPITLHLAKEFYQDYILAILSRGYRSPVENQTIPIALSKGNGPMHAANFCGDEPYLLSHNLPKAFVFVGKDRHKASNMAAKAGVDIILMDDGMQHRRLARDYEVVVIDARDPFGQGFFLPRGFLREGLHSLARANLIVVNHVTNQEDYLKLKNYLSKYTKAPVVGAKMDVLGVFDLNDSEYGSLQGKRVGIFCGIAHPEYFEETVKSLGAEIIVRQFFPDHLGFDQKGLLTFMDRCLALGVETLVCTEKDRVKIPSMPVMPLPLAWIKMHVVLIEEAVAWEFFVNQIRETLKHRK